MKPDYMLAIEKFDLTSLKKATTIESHEVVVEDTYKIPPASEMPLIKASDKELASRAEIGTQTVFAPRFKIDEFIADAIVMCGAAACTMTVHEQYGELGILGLMVLARGITALVERSQLLEPGKGYHLASAWDMGIVAGSASCALVKFNPMPALAGVPLGLWASRNNEQREIQATMAPGVKPRQ